MDLIFISWTFKEGRVVNERTWNQRMLGLTFNVEDGRITIFRSTLEALGWPTHYRFLYNREAKQVAVQNCTAEDAGVHKTPKPDVRPIHSPLSA